MISEETLCKISSELDGLTEEQFVHEVCHMFMVLMVSGGVSDCIYGIPRERINHPLQCWHYLQRCRRYKNCSLILGDYKQ